jgi:hypothetical protein
VVSQQQLSIYEGDTNEGKKDSLKIPFPHGGDGINYRFSNN